MQEIIPFLGSLLSPETLMHNNPSAYKLWSFPSEGHLKERKTCTFSVIPVYLSFYEFRSINQTVTLAGLTFLPNQAFLADGNGKSFTDLGSEHGRTKSHI